jgi:archaemetzincin
MTSATECAQTTDRRRCIGILPFGDIPEITAKSIAGHILGHLRLPVDILPPSAPPSFALDERRLQYDAGSILKTIECARHDAYDKLIGVVDVDLFVPILTYVFGEARQGGRCGVVSIYRLKKNPDGAPAKASVELERTAKVALHELGHLLDLHHCMEENCLMHFSGGIEDLDRAPLYYCRYCTVFLGDALRPGRVSQWAP